VCVCVDSPSVCVCSDASSNVRARAIKDYCNSLDPSHISFREGDLITVRHASREIAAALGAWVAQLGLGAEWTVNGERCGLQRRRQN